jgi:hypothetical protein
MVLLGLIFALVVQLSKKQVIYQKRGKVVITNNKIKRGKTDSYKGLIEGFEQQINRKCPQRFNWLHLQLIFIGKGQNFK